MFPPNHSVVWHFVKIILTIMRIHKITLHKKEKECMSEGVYRRELIKIEIVNTS